VLVGGALMGMLGALIAIPVAEILRILIAEVLASRHRAVYGDLTLRA
jgi:predicted PurR-regulated permease PerM